MIVRCPTCDAMMDANVTSCPLCMRERSRAEIFAGLRGEDPERKVPMVRRLLGYLTMLFGLGILGFCAYRAYWGPPKSVEAREAQSSDTAKDSADRPGRLQGDGARGSREVLEPASEAQVWVPKKEPAGLAAKPSDERNAADDNWRVSGTVFDLVSLSPIRRARLIFTDRQTGRDYPARTDSRGEYQIRLPKLRHGGYALRLRINNREAMYLEDMGPPLRSQTERQRLETVSSFDPSSILHVPILPPFSDSSLRYDLAILPDSGT